nr:hypothetical protein [Tanacetum cinerariifolium]
MLREAVNSAIVPLMDDLMGAMYTMAMANDAHMGFLKVANCDGYYRPPPQAVSPPIAGHKKTLPASVNNVRSMHHLLLKLSFPNASICILTEAESDPSRSPTRRNILMAMEWLTKGCWSGDSLVFYYAGQYHPCSTITTMEMKKMRMSVAGKILDNEVNTILVASLPHGAKLHSIMDTCFSGTLLDLPYLCRINRGGFYKWEDHHPSHVVALYGGTSGGRAICISACDDHQNSADTSRHYTKCYLSSQLQEVLADGGLIYLQWQSPSVAWILRFGPVGHIRRHSGSYIKTTSYQRWQDERLGS